MIDLAAALTGILAGLHAATWGMYKDAPHEGFSRAKYVRSPLIGGLLAIAIQQLMDLDARHAGGFVLLFGATYAVERAVSEIYKTFIRQEDQGKYFIPMQFRLLGRPVQNRRWRLFAGLLYTGVLTSLVAALTALKQQGTILPLWLVLILGSLGGWISAFGGAWKDAPSEGFQLLKFFRSPVLAMVYAAGLFHLTSDIVALTMAATGYTVATTETYKTFFFPSEPRGKFAGRPVIHPQVLGWRDRMLPLYAAIWLTVIGATVVAVAPSP
jgi:hypothetical protein